MADDNSQESDSGDPLDGVMRIIREIAERSVDGDYLYRGEPKHYRRVSSSLYRRREEIEMEDLDINIAQTEILKVARTFVGHADDERILTQLQHYGSATNLIDFTTDSLIALFFACDGEPSENGRVLLLIKSKYPWMPPQSPENRAIAQRSVFVQSPKGYVIPDKSVCVPHMLKGEILEYLRKHHGLTVAAIYNDIHGFIRYHEGRESAYIEFYAGKTHQEKGENAKAIDRYSNAIALIPQLHGAFNNRGTVYATMGEYRRAIQDYDKALKLDPLYVGSYVNRGNAYLQLDESKAAFDDFKSAIEIEPTYSEAYCSRGAAHIKTGNYELAIRDLDRSIELRPHYAEALVFRAMAYAQQGESERGSQDLDKAIELDPDYADAYEHRGRYLIDKREKDRAIQDFSRLLELRPNSAVAHNGRGIALLLKNQIDRAIDDFDRALEINPQFAEALCGRGDAYCAKRDYGTAIQNYSSAIAIDPNYANAYNNRGNSRRYRGEFDKAIQDFNRALELKINDQVATYNNRAHTFSEMKKYDCAIQDYTKSIQLRAQNPEAYFSRSMCRLILKRWKGARKDLIAASKHGFDIKAEFRDTFASAANFERRFEVKLPPNVVAMLSPASNAKG